MAGTKGRSKPPWDLPLGDRIVTDARYICFFAAGAARELLVAAVLAQAAPVARAHVAEVAALAGFACLPRAPARTVGDGFTGEGQGGGGGQWPR